MSVAVTDILALIWFLVGGIVLMEWAGLTLGQTIFAGVWAGIFSMLVTGLPR